MILKAGICRIHLSFCLEYNNGCVNYNNIAGTSIPNTPSIENVYIFETLIIFTWQSMFHTCDVKSRD